MRLVTHPNVVDLKAFFYSNGDKVSLCSLPTRPRTQETEQSVLTHSRKRKMKCTSTLFKNTFPRLYTAQAATTQS